MISHESSERLIHLQEYTSLKERAEPYFHSQDFSRYFDISGDIAVPLLQNRFQSLLSIIQVVHRKAKDIFPELSDRSDSVQGLEDFRLKLQETHWSYLIRLPCLAERILTVSLTFIPPLQRLPIQEMRS